MDTMIVLIVAFVGVTALVGGLAVLLRGLRANVAEERLEMLTGGGSTTGSAAGLPSLLSSPLDETLSSLESLIPNFGSLRTFLEQAGSTLTPSRFVIISLALGGGGAALCLIGIFETVTWVFAAPIAFVVLGSLPFAFGARNSGRAFDR